MHYDHRNQRADGGTAARAEGMTPIGNSSTADTDEIEPPPCGSRRAKLRGAGFHGLSGRDEGGSTSAGRLIVQRRFLQYSCTTALERLHEKFFGEAIVTRRKKSGARGWPNLTNGQLVAPRSATHRRPSRSVQPAASHTRDAGCSVARRQLTITIEKRRWMR